MPCTLLFGSLQCSNGAELQLYKALETCPFASASSQQPDWLSGVLMQTAVSGLCSLAMVLGCTCTWRWRFALNECGHTLNWRYNNESDSHADYESSTCVWHGHGQCAALQMYSMALETFPYIGFFVHFCFMYMFYMLNMFYMFSCPGDRMGPNRQIYVRASLCHQCTAPTDESVYCQTVLHTWWLTILAAMMSNAACHSGCSLAPVSLGLWCRCTAKLWSFFPTSA